MGPEITSHRTFSVPTGNRIGDIGVQSKCDTYSPLMLTNQDFLEGLAEFCSVFRRAIAWTILNLKFETFCKEWMKGVKVLDRGDGAVVCFNSMLCLGSNLFKKKKRSKTYKVMNSMNDSTFFFFLQST